MDSSTAAAAENTASQPPKSSKGGTSNLYLVTFLATLFLLLSVSCAIVLRSYFVRRRYQRQVAQALAQGIILTPRAPGSRKKRFGIRPHMYEGWIAPLHVSGVSGSHVSAQEKPQGGRWCDMLPLTVQTVVVKRRTKDPNATSPLASPLNSPDPNAASPLFLFPPADRNNGPIQFPEAATPVEGPPPRPQPPFRNFLSRGLSFLPSARGGSTRNPNSHSTHSPLVQSRFGLLEMPHPNSTPLPPQEPRSEDILPTRDRERERERRESATWRAIVSPSPSLANAFTGGPNPTGGSTAEQQTNNHRRTLSSPSSPANGEVRRPRLTLPVPMSTLGGAMNGNRDSAIAVSPISPGPASAVGGATKYRIRTEMLQISVLVAMPNIRMSTLYGDAGVVKRLRAAELGGWGYRGPKLADDSETKGKMDTKQKSKMREEDERIQREDEDEDEIVEVPGDESSSSEEGEDDEDEEEEDHVPLPELVLGVMRLNYRHNSAARSSPTDRSPPTFVIPSSPPPPPPVPIPIPVPTAVFDPPEPQEGQVLARHDLGLAAVNQTQIPPTHAQRPLAPVENQLTHTGS